MTSPEIKFPCPVRRISVAWRDGKWMIEDETRIESMTLPKSYEPPGTEGRRGVSGFWYEIVDDNGRALYRQLLPDPFDSGMELFNEDGTISRTETMPHEVTFDVLTPDLPEVAELHFYSSSRPEGPAERIAGRVSRTAGRPTPATSEIAKRRGP